MRLTMQDQHGDAITWSIKFDSDTVIQYDSLGVHTVPHKSYHDAVRWIIDQALYCERELDMKFVRQQ